jgi:positive regulator of sigma E activity
MKIYEDFVNEMRLIAQTQLSIQYFIVGIILLPVSFGATNSIFIFIFLFGIAAGCLIMAHITAKDAEKKKAENRKLADLVKK